ncbi:MAG: hypothetical protein ACUVQY_05970 [Thermoproteota archaeon]
MSGTGNRNVLEGLKPAQTGRLLISASYDGRRKYVKSHAFFYPESSVWAMEFMPGRGHYGKHLDELLTALDEIKLFRGRCASLSLRNCQRVLLFLGLDVGYALLPVTSRVKGP